MAGQVLHTLLSSGEYDEIEDVVMADGEFIEMDEKRKAIRQVILGITPYNLIIAERILTDYKKYPEVYFLTDVDPYLIDLEVASVWPLCLVRIDLTRINFNLSILFYNRVRHYVLTNTHFNKDLEDTWGRWIDRIYYIREDPYGYIRSQYDLYGFPYPEYYLKLTNSKDTNTNETFSKNTSVESKIKKNSKKIETVADDSNCADDKDKKDNGIVGNKKKSKRFSKYLLKLNS